MLTEDIKSTFKDASRKLTGFKKRAFMAKVSQNYFNGFARQAETILGWSRDAVKKGLKELETGIVCLDNYRGRGRNKTEQNLPFLTQDIESLLTDNVSADPKLKSVLAYTRISAAKIREALINEKGYHTEQLPSCQTIGDILNRMGYSLKKPKKSNL